jgi:hypothetical protein
MTGFDGIVDYSAYRTFETCPAEWFEKYINKRQRPWPKALRDDALCLGSLVHEGLQVWQERHVVEIPQAAIDENTPSPETLLLALELVTGYTRHYPEERWPLILCEEPLLFPLSGALQGLAKLDAFFYVPEPTMIESGQPGLIFTLSEGWWVHEYKTKSPDQSLALFMQKWGMNMQASFQHLALQHHIDANYRDAQWPINTVQGVLVNVLEKPKRHVPKRKCKGCAEQFEYATYLPCGDGRYSCPVCGHRQELTKLKESTTCQNGEYYRILVTRTPEQLAKAKHDIVQVGQRMQAMTAGGLQSETWHTENCIRYKNACPYYDNHLNGQDTLADITMVPVGDYRGLAGRVSEE